MSSAEDEPKRQQGPTPKQRAYVGALAAEQAGHPDARRLYREASTDARVDELEATGEASL